MATKALRKTFSRPRYTLLALTISTLVFAFAVSLPNWRLLYTLFTSSSVGFTEALSLLFSLFLSIGTNFTLVSASYTVIIAILFGVNVAMLSYYVSQRKGPSGDATKGGVLGMGGMVSGVLGIGCASCGTFILTSVLALVGAGGVVAFLPLGGEEFGILGVVLMGYATYWTTKKIEEPLVCTPE